jgi:cyclomaltodextrinase
MARLSDTLFYHVYPLGLCGAPANNPQDGVVVPRLRQLHDWIPHWQRLGVGGLYLGPVFASERHGYDTCDFGQVDSRLGDAHDLANLCAALDQAGIKVVLDGVFHHVGRGFWAFQDVLQHGPHSAYCDWFELNFSQRSPHGDPFAYACWEGHSELVKLNLSHPAVRQHLFDAIHQWRIRYGIKGLRLDVAYALPPDFLQALADFCRAEDPDFWLLGEVIHGDYRPFLQTLDSVTNYECYKGLWSSHNDHNYFEISYSLNRLFGPEGIYRGQQLYNFADNHDVNRVASQLHDPQHLYPLYLLLYTLPGLPSLYYGSEAALPGLRTSQDDRALRPALPWDSFAPTLEEHPLVTYLQRLWQIRTQVPALAHGDYQQVWVQHEQLAFLRQSEESCCVVVANMAAHETEAKLSLPPGQYRDMLSGETYTSDQRALSIPAYGGRILVRQ